MGKGLEVSEADHAALGGIGRDPGESVLTHEDRSTAATVVLLAGFAGALGAGLREVLGRDAGLEVVVEDCLDALPAVIVEHEPGAVLINCEALSSVIELRKLVLAQPATAIVVAVPRQMGRRDDSLLSAGARAVMPITTEPEEMRAVLRFVARGLVGPPRAPAGDPPTGLGLLTRREAEVLELLAERRSAVHIAEALHVSVATVNSHRRHIYEKLGVHSRQELASYAAQFVEAPETEGGAPGRERLAYWRRIEQPRERDRAVVIDFCQALGARRWLGRSG